MRKYLRELKPTHIEDLIAMNALYRPGPMNNIPEFIERKHGRKKITYPHPLLEEVLKPTYGIMVYQEQIMLRWHRSWLIILLDLRFTAQSNGKENSFRDAKVSCVGYLWRELGAGT
jgi:hypothetical protein